MDGRFTILSTLRIHKYTNKHRHILAAADARRKLVVIVHGSTPTAAEEVEEEGDKEEGQNGSNKARPRRQAVRVEEVAAFKRARALYPLRPRPALRAMPVPQMQPAAAGAATE